jgi:tape measure domain-containing protein
MADLASLVVKVTSKGVDKTTAELNKLDKEGAKAEKSTNKLSKSFGGLKAAVTAAASAIAVLGIARIVRETADAGIALDSINSSLIVATGSTQAAGIEFAFLRQEAARLGLDLRASAGAYASLAAAARGTNLQGQATRDIFSGISEAMTALGRGSQETERALLAVEQMISKGTVSAEELRGQLGEVLPGAFQMAARSMGVTTQELGKMLQNGEVLAEDLLPRLAQSLSSTFSTQAEARAEGLQAQINNFKTAVFELMSTGNMQGMADAIADITSMISNPAFQEGFAAFVGGTIRLGGFLAERAAAVGAFFTDSLEEQAEQANEIVNNLERRLASAKNPMAKLRIKEELAEAREEAERLQQAIWGAGQTNTNLNLPAPEKPQSTTQGNGLPKEADFGDTIIIRAQEQVAAVDLVAERYEELNMAAERLNDTLKTPQEIYQDEITLLNELIATTKEGSDERLISYETYTRGVHEAQDKLEKSVKGSNEEMTEFAKQAARNMQSSFADYLYDPFKDGVDGMAKGFIDSLRRMAAEAAASKIFDLVGGSLKNTGIGGSIAGFFGFADGGVMSSGGSMPLKAYSKGGVANSPQLALFGEGRMNEAYVPLPDGRSIPVTMNGPQAQPITIVNNGAPVRVVSDTMNGNERQNVRWRPKSFAAMAIYPKQWKASSDLTEQWGVDDNAGQLACNTT